MTAAHAAGREREVGSRPIPAHPSVGDLRDLLARVSNARRRLQADLSELDGWDANLDLSRLQAAVGAFSALLDAEIDIRDFIAQMDPDVRRLADNRRGANRRPKRLRGVGR